MKKFEKTKIRCLACDEEFEISINDKRDQNRKFCSKSCSVSFNNKKRTTEIKQKISNTLKNKIEKENKPICLMCEKQVKTIKNVYCSNKCQNEDRYINYIKDWKNNIVDGKKGDTVSKYIRRYLFEKYDSKCEKCGWSFINEFTGNIPLEVEHIDGNSENNKEENLTLLCPNCHSLTKTYKGANRGNGRYNRRQRYKDGKSF